MQKNTSDFPRKSFFQIIHLPTRGIYVRTRVYNGYIIIVVVWLYFYRTRICTRVLGSLQKIHRSPFLTILYVYGKGGGGWVRRVSESDVTVGAACGGEKCHFVFGVYVEYTFAWGKTLPVPNPRTGNRRPFQFLLLSAQV